MPVAGFNTRFGGQTGLTTEGASYRVRPNLFYSMVALALNALLDHTRDDVFEDIWFPIPGLRIPGFPKLARHQQHQAYLQRNLDAMKRLKQDADSTYFEMVLKRPSMKAKPAFQMPVLYVAPQGDKPVLVISVGVSSLLDGMEPFLNEMKAQGYGLVVYHRALQNMQDNNRTLSSYRLSKQAFEQVLIDDLDELSQALDGGTYGVRVPFEKQVLIGHSAGAVFSAKMAARHPERPYPKLIMISPPRSMPDVFQNLLSTEIFPWARRQVDCAQIQAVAAGLLDLTTIPPGALNMPILVINGGCDGLTQGDSKKWHDEYRSASPSTPMGFMEIYGATHEGVVNEHNYSVHGPQPVDLSGWPNQYQANPYQRLTGVVCGFLEDPNDFIGREQVRFGRLNQRAWVG